MKGITPVIAVILLLLITIAIIGFTSVFFQQTVTTGGEQAQEAAAGQANKALQTEEMVDVSNGKVTIKNVGTEPISTANVQIFVDGDPAATTPVGDAENIQPGSTKTFDIAVPPGTGERKITVAVPGNVMEKTFQLDAGTADLISAEGNVITLKNSGVTSIQDSEISMKVDGAGVTFTGPASLAAGAEGVYTITPSSIPAGSGTRAVEIRTPESVHTADADINIGTISLEGITGNKLSIKNTGLTTVAKDELILTVAGQGVTFTGPAQISPDETVEYAVNEIEILGKEGLGGVLSLQSLASTITDNTAFDYASATKGYWKFDDLDQGKTIKDSSGNGMDGTFVGTTYDGTIYGASSVGGELGYGNALNFDGVDDSVKFTMGSMPPAVTYTYRAAGTDGVWHHYANANGVQYVDGAPTAYTNNHCSTIGNVISLGGPHEPSGVSGLVMWLKADAITGLSDGNSVTTWTDSSSAGHSVTEPTAIYKPVYKSDAASLLNGKPVVRFDGNDHLYGGVLGATDVTVIAVAGRATPASLTNGNIYAYALIGTRPDQNGWGLYYLWANPAPGAAAGFRAWNIAQDTWWTGYDANWHILSGTLRGVIGANNIKIFGDGTERGSGSVSGTTNNNPANAVNVGWVGIDHHFKGDMAEVMVYNRVLPNNERKEIESYLAKKYGLTISSPVPYFQGKIDEFRVYGRALSQMEIQSDMISHYPLLGVVASYSFESIQAGKAIDTHFIVRGNNDAPSDPNGALKLNGIDEYVEIGNPAALRVAGGDFSVSAQSYARESRCGMEIIEKANNIICGTDTNGGWSLGGNNGYYVFRVSDGAALQSRMVKDTALGLNQWIHSVGTRGGNGIKLYVNGAKIDNTKDVTGFTIDDTKNLRLGGSVTAWRFNGLIDEVRIMSRAVSKD